ncbi:MAG: hypothetical protein JWQ40_2009 [Segetibacter sp.]|jgi:hypothetical protein|nr:hypothetical protein [Segetibacter sp.]
MDTNSDNTNEGLKIFSPNPAQQIKTHEGEKDPDEEGTLIKEEEISGMDMGTTYKEDKEQDLDDLIHSQASLVKKSEFPGPDEV